MSGSGLSPKSAASFAAALALVALATGCGADAMGAAGLDTMAAKRRTNPSPSPSPSPSPTPSATSGTILWQVALVGPYSAVRPVIGPDGTVYAIDVLGNLYAVSAAGALKWQVAGAGNKGLAVGPDGTVYTGSEDVVRAFAPDGTPKWTFIQDPRAFILLGLAVGPDGNVYGVATQGLGVFSLTPAGALRWAVPETYDRPNVSYGEIVFGPNGGSSQLYFYANAHVRGIELTGKPVFTLVRGGQPAVSPLDGSVHLGDSAYKPDGSLLWSFGLSAGDTPDVGSDGATYFSFLQSTVYSLDARGSQRWTATASDWVQGPVVDPTNARVVLVGNDPATFGGVLAAWSTGGAGLWRLPLPPVGGVTQGFDTRVRYTADGATAYLITTVNTGSFSTSHAYLTAVGM